MKQNIMSGTGRGVRETAKRASLWLAVAIGLLIAGGGAHAQRTVNFPPAESPPPPPAKAPPKTQAGGEETDIIPDPGPSMRKTQHRTPPPPTNLCVIYKVEYGETLQ